MKPALSTLALAGLLVAPAAVAQQSEGGGLRLAGADAAALDVGARIPDIQQHRIRSLDYVRRLEDVVHLDTSGVDIEADPVMFLDGAPISRAEFRRRAVMYMGVSEVDRFVVSTITLAERDRRVAAGEDPDRFAVDEAVVSQKMADHLDTIRMNVEQQVANSGDPDQKQDLEELQQQAIDMFFESIEESAGGMDYFRQLLAADAAFEKVFMPDAKSYEAELGEPIDIGEALANEPERPEWYPEATWRALDANEQTENLRYFLMNSVLEGNPIPSFFKTNIVQQIKDGLVEDTGLEFFFDDSSLPSDVIFRLGDRLVKTDELWPQVSTMLTPVDVELIVRELVKLRTMRSELEDAGFWFTDAEFAELFEAHEGEYEGTLFPLKNLIIFRGYTWIDRYREHYRYRKAYAAMLQEDLSDEEVLAHYQTGGRLFFERGNAVVDAAYAHTLDGFNQREFDEAEARLIDRLAELGGDFMALSEALPMPQTAKQRGDDRSFQRAPLRLRIAESELSIFVTGYSLADDAFYHGVPGEIFGPWPQRCRRHAWGGETNAGVWMLRVDGFTRRQPLAPFEGRNKELAIEDYTDLMYQHWSEELLEDVVPTISFDAN